MKLTNRIRRKNVHQTVKLTLVGGKEYKEEIEELRVATAELRAETDKLNLSLEKQAELVGLLKNSNQL